MFRNRSLRTALISATLVLIFVSTWAYGINGSSNKSHTKKVSVPRTTNTNLNETFSIDTTSAYVIGTSPLSISFKSIENTGNIKIEVLAPTNTRSDLFTFVNTLAKRSVISSMSIPLNQTLLDGTSQGHYSLTLPVNSDPNGLAIKTNGVYPLKITHVAESGESTSQYTFVTYVTSVSETNSAYAEKLNIVPIVTYSPIIDRRSIFNNQNQLSIYGKNKLEELKNTQNTISSLDSLAPHATVLSPETFSAYQSLNPLQAVEKLPSNFLSPVPQGSQSENITDTYSPLNAAELEKNSMQNQLSDQLTYGRSIITGAGFVASSRTLVTQSITKTTISEVVHSGIDNIIVDDSTFASDSQPSSKPALLEAGESDLKVATSLTSINKNMPASFSPSAKANYLIAATSVIALEKPSVKRSIIVPIDLEHIDKQTAIEFFKANSTSPLISFETPQTFFSQEIDKPLSKKINKMHYGFVDSASLKSSSISRISRAANGISTMFNDNSEFGIQSNWMKRVVYSKASRNIGRHIKPSADKELIDSVSRQIALPEKRTLTITSRNSYIPVTIHNSTNGPVSLVVVLSSDKLSFPKGNRFIQEVSQENTTIKIPVQARTSGSFPISFSIETPKESITVAQNTATVRSTAVSGIGIAIALGSLIFLAIWWTAHSRRAKKHPTAPVIPISPQKSK